MPILLAGTIEFVHTEQVSVLFMFALTGFAVLLLVGNPERKRPLGRSRHRRVNNIKMDIGEIVLGGVD
jgi:hypothetical protein